MKELFKVEQEVIVSKDGKDFFDDLVDPITEEKEEAFMKAVEDATGKKIRITFIIEEVEKQDEN